MQDKRRSLSRCVIGSAGLSAQKHLAALSLFKQAEMVALYSPVRNEVATSHLFEEAISAGKRVCYPTVTGEQIFFQRVENSADLRPGTFGVLEPAGGDPVDVEQIDLMVIPGLAFSSCGERLGYGKGFYDRFLACPVTFASIGLCYDFQVYQKLPVEEHDQRVSYIVTEHRVIDCSANPSAVR